MSATPYVVKWGILGCGWISSEFVMDLCRPMESRKVTDVCHAIVSVGSRSFSKAEHFITKYCPEGGSAQKSGLVDTKPKACGTYQDVVDDKNVEIVYVGTLNTLHYDDAKMVLQGGKNCLLEKPATLNAAEWRDLMAIAKSQKVFLMEAVWTIFNPVALAIQKAVHVDNVIGDIRCIYSDHSMDVYGKRPDTDRVLSAESAGGALLDLGPYPMVWALMILFNHPMNERTPPSSVGSTMLLHETGVDLGTTWGLTFPKINAMAFCSASLLANVNKTCNTRIVGSTGEIIVKGFTSRPTSYVIKRLIKPEIENGKFHPDEIVDMDFDGWGLYWEADAVARNLRDGLLESPSLPHDETLMVMEIFDKIRNDGGYKYLPGLERIPLN